MNSATTICPRCEDNFLHENEVHNSLSRRDNKTYICNYCGEEEAYIDAGLMPMNELEFNFKIKLIKEN